MLDINNCDDKNILPYFMWWIKGGMSLWVRTRFISRAGEASICVSWNVGRSDSVNERLVQRLKNRDAYSTHATNKLCDKAVGRQVQKREIDVWGGSIFREIRRRIRMQRALLWIIQNVNRCCSQPVHYVHEKENGVLRNTKVWQHVFVSAMGVYSQNLV